MKELSASEARGGSAEDAVKLVTGRSWLRRAAALSLCARDQDPASALVMSRCAKTSSLLEQKTHTFFKFNRMDLGVVSRRKRSHRRQYLIPPPRLLFAPVSGRLVPTSVRVDSAGPCRRPVGLLHAMQVLLHVYGTCTSAELAINAAAPPYPEMYLLDIIHLLTAQTRGSKNGHNSRLWTSLHRSSFASYLIKLH